MPINSESLNRKLYDLLKVRGYNPIPKDSEGETTPVPDEAEVMKFTFSADGKDYGEAWVTVDSSQNLIIYYDDGVTDSDDEVAAPNNWSSLLNQLKNWAQRRQLSFELKNKNHLASDMAQRSHMKKKERIAEGYHPMGKSASYNDNIPTVKIVLQHTRQIQEGEQRYRNIAKIFLENQQGERILCPSTKPGIAQIYARHLAEGGLPHDERWNHIGSLVEEYSRMAGFVRATRNGQFNESAQQLVNEGINHYNSLRETLGKMRGHRGYQAYFENYTPALMETEGDESINELFVQETMDPRIESVMPILARLHKKVNEMSEVSELAEWADKLIEGDGGQEALNPVGIPEEDLTEQLGDVRDQEDFQQRMKVIQQYQMTQRADPKRSLAKIKQALIQKAKAKGLDTSKYELEEDLGPEQKKVGQLGPNSDHAKEGDLVGALEESMDPERRQRLDDLIDEFRDSVDPNEYNETRDFEDVLNDIRAEFGDKIADQVDAGARKMHFPRDNHTHGYDPLGWKKTDNRVTKAGKLFKQDSDYLKNTMKSRFALNGKSAVSEDDVEEGIVDKIRAMNYDRLARRSFDKADDEFDKMDDFAFSNVDAREPYEKEFSRHVEKMQNRRNKAAALRGKPQDVDEGKFTINAKTGAKLDPKTGAELPAKEKPVKIAAPKTPAAPKLTLSDVWRKVEEVVGQIYPDGDPIDWLLPWFRKQGIADHKVGDILERAAKKNGYKDIYDYYNSFGDDLGLAEDHTGSIGNPMYDAVCNRFMRHPEGLKLLQQFGPETVMSAIDDVTDGWEGEEIGTSDVSAYFKRAAELLQGSHSEPWTSPNSPDNHVPDYEPQKGWTNPKLAEEDSIVNENDLGKALASLRGSWSGWHKDDSADPDVETYFYDDGEGGHYASGTIEHNLQTGEITVDYEGEEGDKVQGTFNSVGDAMRALRGGYGGGHGSGTAPNFDRLGNRPSAGPDDIRKTDRTGKQGTLTKGRIDTMKASSPSRINGPKGVLPEGQEDLDAIRRMLGEGIKGEIAGGTVGGLVGGMAGGAALGPVGTAIGGALGSATGSAIGGRWEDEKPLKEREQLDEFAPLIAAGARMLVPLLARVGPALGRMAAGAGRATANVAGKAATGVGRGAVEVGKSAAQSAAQNAGKIGLGVGAYQAITDVANSMVGGVGQVYNDIGSAASEIAKVVGGAIDSATIRSLAEAAVKYAIPIGILLAVVYGGKKLIDKVMSEGTDDTLAGVAGQAIGAVTPNPNDFVKGFNKQFEGVNEGQEDLDAILRIIRK